MQSFVLSCYNWICFMCRNSNLLHFKLQVLCYNNELCVSCCSKKLRVSCCYILSYKFHCVTFQTMGFVLLHFKLQVFHWSISSYRSCVLCVIATFWAWNHCTIVVCFAHVMCNNNSKKNWNQNVKFSFLFHPFDQSYIFLWNCLWTLCATIALTTIVLNFVEASNDKLFIFSSCDFACICIFYFTIKVGFLWFHVCVFSILPLRFFA